MLGLPWFVFVFILIFSVGNFDFSLVVCYIVEGYSLTVANTLAILTIRLTEYLQIGCKSMVVFLALTQLSVDEADQHDLTLEANGLVGGAVDVLREDVFETVFLNP